MLSILHQKQTCRPAPKQKSTLSTPRARPPHHLPVVVEQVVQPAGDDDAGVAAEPHHCVNAASKGWDEAGDGLLERGDLKRRRVPEQLPDAVRVAPRRASSANHGCVDCRASRGEELNFTVADITVS